MEHSMIINGYQRREKCACCEGENFETILDLGIVPLAGYFPTFDELDNESKYPLSLLVCNDCKLVQTDSVIDPRLLFEDYRYLSSVGLSNHFKNVADILNERYSVNNKDILEIGCSSGFMLNKFKENNINTVGVEPSGEFLEFVRNNGSEAYKDLEEVK